jgi:LCP family protein required for cell wall assembly
MRMESMILDEDQPTARGRGRSPSLAALLSFLWPGLGQWYVGNRRAAAIFAVPLVLVLLLLVYALRRGPVFLAAQLFADRPVGVAAVVIVLLVGAWRLAAVLHAFVGGEKRKTSQVDRLVVAAVAAVIVLTHLGSGYYLLAYSDAGSIVFEPKPNNPALIDQSTPSPAPGQTAGPTGAPLPTPVEGGRVTILFTGLSSGGAYLYDSIMVVSYDKKSHSVQMISVPRDTASFPLYFGGVYTDKINSVPYYVKTGKIKSPDNPYATLVKEVGYLVGLPINYYAVMDLNGFVKMIDAVKGIDVVNPTAISDPTYDWLDGSPYGFYLSAGSHHLNGRQALAYVRSRHTNGEFDWGRSSRQQEVLVDLLHKMAQPSQILALPNLISTLGSSIATDFPSNQVADYVADGQSLPSGSIKQLVLGPPYSIPVPYDPYYRYCLLNDKVAALSIDWFGQDSTWYGKPTPANTCP